jgi:hypothetical protein
MGQNVPYLRIHTPFNNRSLQHLENKNLPNPSNKNSLIGNSNFYATL